jgi:hypothetical protein
MSDWAIINAAWKLVPPEVWGSRCDMSWSVVLVKSFSTRVVALEAKVMIE